MKLEAEKYLEMLESNKKMYEIQNNIARNLWVPNKIMENTLAEIEDAKSDIGKNVIYNLDDEFAETLRMNEEFKGFQLEALLRINEILNEMDEKAEEVYGLN
jgi:hypothetical protein